MKNSTNGLAVLLFCHMMLKVKIKEFVKQIQNIGFVNNLEQLAQPVYPYVYQTLLSLSLQRDYIGSCWNLTC